MFASSPLESYLCETIHKVANRRRRLYSTMPGNNLKWLLLFTVTLEVIQSPVLAMVAPRQTSPSQFSHSPWSSWSSCSATCGPGIARRERSCITQSQGQVTCDEDVETQQFKVCENQPCIDEPSARTSGCSEYDNKVFSGRQYTWEPFVHRTGESSTMSNSKLATAPCKLSCKAKGSNLYANLADKVQDGVPCTKDGSTLKSVCFNGDCEPIGCDDVIGSSAAPDKCGVCQGDGSACRTISGIFTSTQLQRGLNHVISFPPGSTSINITELSPSRNLLLLQTITGKTLITDGSRPGSGVVTAAGTVFVFSTKTPAQPLQRINATGPTNETIVLKLLSRGFNPGVMYSFSVPVGTGDAFVREITHQSQLPEPEAERETRNDQKLSPPKTEEDFTDSKLLDEPSSNSKEENKKEVVEATTRKIMIVNNPMYIPSETETAREAFDPHEADYVYKTSDVISHSNEYQNRADNAGINSPTSDDLLKEDTRREENDFDEYEEEETEDEEVSVEDSDNDDDDKDNLDDVNDEKVKELLEDHQATFRTDEEDPYTIDRLMAAGPKQSATVRLGSVVDPSEMENWASDNSSSVTLDESSGELIGKHEDTVEEDNQIEESNERNDRFEDVTQATPDTESEDISREEETQFLNIEEDEGSVLPQDNADRIVQRNRPNVVDRRPAVVVDHNKDSYTIPKYSQSFTFAERYKQIYGGRSNRNRYRTSNHRRRSHHSRSRERTTPTASRPVVVNNSPTHLQNNGDTENQAVRSGYRRPIRLHQQPPYDSNGGRGVATSALEASPTQSESRSHSYYVRQKERQRSITLQEMNREQRRRDRQYILEERERRLRERREEYQRRLREYQEQLARRREEELRRRQPQPTRASRRYHQSSSLSRQSLLERGNADNVNNVNQRREVTTSHYEPDGRNQPRRVQQPVVDSRNQLPGSSSKPMEADTDGNRHTGSAFTQEQAIQSPSTQTDVVGQNNDTDSIFNRRIISRVQPPQEIPEEDTPNVVPTEQSPRYPVEQDAYVPSAYAPSRPHVIPSQRHIVPNSNVQTSIKQPRVVSPLTSTDRDLASQQRPDTVSALDSNEIPTVDRRNQVQPAVNQLESARPVGPAVGLPQTNIGGVGSPQANIGVADILPNQIPLNTLTSQDVARSAAYEWRISGLTDCTHTCGGGLQQTVIVCLDTFTQATVTDNNCQHLKKPKKFAVKCNTRPCPAVWTPGPWSSCSVTCGEGEQTRRILCQTRVSPTLNLTMPETSCEDQEALPDTQSCIQNACSSWRLGEWSNCSTGCGEGLRTRDVQCVDLDGKVVEDEVCVDLKPDSEETCNSGACGKGWFYTDWPDECPVECGSGQKRRRVFCSSDDGEILPHSRCDHTHKPSTEQSCKVDRPCGGEWFAGDWSECNATCGSSFKTRGILCIKSLKGGIFAVVGEENCEGVTKPLNEEACSMPDCPSEWYMTSWTQCSQSCGTGYRTREVKCLDAQHKASGTCPLNKRPRTRDACNTQSCDGAVTSTEDDPNCRDKFQQCDVVKRSRLCRIKYYQKACCASCKKGTDDNYDDDDDE